MLLGIHFLSWAAWRFRGIGLPIVARTSSRAREQHGQTQTRPSVTPLAWLSRSSRLVKRKSQANRVSLALEPFRALPPHPPRSPRFIWFKDEHVFSCRLQLQRTLARGRHSAPRLQTRDASPPRRTRTRAVAPAASVQRRLRQYRVGHAGAEYEEIARHMKSIEKGEK